MADLEITCPDCSKVLTISEFVDDGALVCRGCGKTLPRPASVDDGKTKQKRHLTATGGPVLPAEEDEPGPTNAIWPGKKKLTKADMKARVTHHLYAGAIFIVLGALMAWLRYGGGLPPDMMARERAYAMYGLLVLHACIVLKAFEDTVFQGILCLLVPFYSIYYLACESDSVYLKAIIAAVVIGIGQDGADALQVEFMRICKTVNEWIGSGGGPV